MTKHATTPHKDGYTMPAEWMPHEATWLAWPHSDNISFPGALRKVLPVFAKLVDALADSEEVRICVNDAAEEKQALDVLRPVRHSHVRFFHIPTNEPWCRDHGPIFVTRKKSPQLALIDWGYNAWGFKYPPFELDDAVPGTVAELLGVPCYAPDMVLEGGSVDVNGAGYAMATEACLLNPNRNPELDKKAIEKHLRDYLGIKHMIWLGDGIEGDDTDGHIDMIARFASSKTILTVIEENSDDENHQPLKDNYERLEKLIVGDQQFEIETLPMPSKVLRDGLRLPASYANFYIANKVVLMPCYSDPNDKLVRAKLERCFPDREIVCIDSRDLVWGLGSFHCLTQQQPAV